MTRYIRQRDEYSCGPVAIVNAMKWLGFHTTAADLPRLKEECYTEVGSGTWPPDLNRAICRNISRARWIKSPTLPQLDHYLSLGRAAILGYSYLQDDDVEDAHYALIIQSGNSFPDTQRPDWYFMANDVNPANGKIIGSRSFKTREEMRDALYYVNEDGDRAEVWFI